MWVSRWILTACFSLNLTFFMRPSQCLGAILPGIMRSESRPGGHESHEITSASTVGIVRMFSASGFRQPREETREEEMYGAERDTHEQDNSDRKKPARHVGPLGSPLSAWTGGSRP